MEVEQQVMELNSRVLPTRHPNLLASMANLASTYRNQARCKKVDELEGEAVETSSRSPEGEFRHADHHESSRVDFER